MMHVYLRMSIEHKLQIKQLNSSHDRASFTCGNDHLDHYLKKQAKQDMKRRICRVYCITQNASPADILGFYTLSSLSIDLGELTPDIQRKLPRHPIPAALIGRLAVKTEAQGLGIGKIMLANAIWRTLKISDEIGIYAMVVDAINESASRFYQQFGFTTLTTNSRLFLPLPK